MSEGLDGQSTNCTLTNAGEQRIAQLSKRDHRNTPEAVGDDHRKGPGKEQKRCNRSGAVPLWTGQGVNRIFECKRGEDRNDLGKDEGEERQHHPALKIEPAGWPKVRKDRLQGRKLLSAAAFNGPGLHAQSSHFPAAEATVSPMGYRGLRFRSTAEMWGWRCCLPRVPLSWDLWFLGVRRPELQRFGLDR